MELQHEDAAKVSGEARIGDKLVASVQHALCTFAPMEMFDEPDEVKAQYRAFGTALINFRDGQMSLAVPTIYFRPDSFDGSILTRRVDFVKMSF